VNRSTGSGLLVFGIVLGVVGAIMRFAVKVHTSGFSIHTAGVILLIVGIGCAIIGLILIATAGRSRSVTQESVQATPSGQVRTEERSDSGFTS
jgi:membrane-bound ClpP family serine protease